MNPFIPLRISHSVTSKSQAYALLSNSPPSVHSSPPLPTLIQAPLPPLLPTPKPHQPPRTHPIAAPLQRRHLQIQRAIDAGLLQQPPHGLQAAHHAQDRRPVLLQHIQADLARLELDVRVADPGDERDGRRGVRVRGRDADREQPAPGAVGGGRGEGCPGEDGAEREHVGGGGH